MNDKKIKVAYLLLAHQNIEQLNLFIEQLLHYGDCDVFVHIDKKNESLCKKIIKDNHVYVCSEYEVKWGSFEICKAGIKLMEMAKISGKVYTHFYYGSGQDLIVKKGLYEYLSNNSDKVFVRINGKVSDKDRSSARYRVRWPKKLMIRNDYHIVRFIRIAIQLLCKFGIVLFKNKKTLTKQIDFYEGRTWFIAPFEVLEYIIDFIRDNRDYYDFWEDSLASDLMFFQTIIMNSQYAESVAPELMYVNFGKTFGTSNHPISVQKSDNENIENGNYFCARKFDLRDRETIDFYINKTLGL